MARASVGGDALLGGAGIALAVFIFSGGVYAGGAGPARGAVLAAGLLGLLVCVVLVVLYARWTRNRAGG